MPLLLTLISGLFFLVGIIIYHFVDNKSRITNASLGAATIVMLGLLIFDLIPELVEINKPILILFVLIGLGVIYLIDKLVPHHHHEHHEHDEETKEHKGHLEHIGIITILALLLHNMVEGMALYNVATTSIKSGILMMISVSLHNLPFGFQIAGMDIKKHKRLLIILLVLSGLIGGVIMTLFGTVSQILEGAIIALTLGMLIHLLIFEFLPELRNNIKQVHTIYGIILGVIILIIVNLI